MINLNWKNSILIATIFTVLACQENSNIGLDYCQMLKDDQSYVSSDRTDMKLFRINKEKRHKLIKCNFRKLIESVELNGFPEIGQLNASGIDSCRNWAVTITLFHIGQIEPQLYFEEGTIAILHKEIVANRLDKGALFPAIREGFAQHTFCTADQKRILNALNLWGLEKSDLPEIKMEQCD